MTQSAEPAATASVSQAALAENILHEGEVVILALKPSPWFVLLTSKSIIALAVIVLAAAYLAQRVFEFEVPVHVVQLVCIAAVLLRVFVACFQWVARLYLLTNVRVMRIHGVLHADIAQCRLRAISRIVVTASGGERLLGVGGLLFESDQAGADEVAWLHIARPGEVQQLVEQTIRRAR